MPTFVVCLLLQRLRGKQTSRSPAAISSLVESRRAAAAALTQINKRLIAKEAAISPLSASIAASLSTSTVTNGSAAVSHANTAAAALSLGLMPFDLRAASDAAEVMNA